MYGKNDNQHSKVGIRYSNNGKVVCTVEFLLPSVVPISFLDTVNPEFAIVVETTTAADIPEIESGKQVCNLGKGAVVSVMDRSTIYDKEMVKLAFDIASDNNISAQYKRAVAGGNDSGAIHQSRGGVRTLAISLPCRYLHAPNCIANKNDCESVMKLTEMLATEIAGGKLN
jgi:endoglucanase